MPRHLIKYILTFIKPENEDYSNEVESKVRQLVDETSGTKLADHVLWEIDQSTNPEDVAWLFDILLWFPGVDVPSLVDGLQTRRDRNDDVTREIVVKMHAGVDDDDPLAWIRQTFPERKTLE